MRMEAPRTAFASRFVLVFKDMLVPAQVKMEFSQLEGDDSGRGRAGGNEGKKGEYYAHSLRRARLVHYSPSPFLLHC